MLKAKTKDGEMSLNHSTATTEEFPRIGKTTEI